MRGRLVFASDACVVGRHRAYHDLRPDFRADVRDRRTHGSYPVPIRERAVPALNGYISVGKEGVDE